jgi:hypothetical protein
MRFKIIDFANVFFKKTHLKMSKAADSLSRRGRLLIFINRAEIDL